MFYQDIKMRVVKFEFSTGKVLKLKLMQTGVMNNDFETIYSLNWGDRNSVNPSTQQIMEAKIYLSMGMISYAILQIAKE